MKIRQETNNDYAQVYDLIKSAFETAEHRDGNEQDLVGALRKEEAFIPKLSLVAEIDGKIVGHILFTKAQVGADTVLVLAPLSVSPAHQKQGVGMALIREGHKRAREHGYSYSLVLGRELYYPKAGDLARRTIWHCRSRRYSRHQFYGDASTRSGETHFGRGRLRKSVYELTASDFFSTPEA